ncbi:phosphotransferase [Nonomuraea polychroma]|uniref:phosphotransferase n=1 Tax=Nonomuraea polychroma TaxID=46176 RepID=UPI003D8DEF18
MTRGWKPVSGRASISWTFPRLRRLWARMRSLPRSPAGDVMTHGDLIPGNVLVSASRLAGVLDVGGFGPADPALDYVESNPAMSRMGRRTVERILADESLP